MSAPVVICLIAGLLLLLIKPAHAVGFQRAKAGTTYGHTFDLGIWYPSCAPTTTDNPFKDPLTRNAPLEKTNLPLIVISHGYGGWLGSHHDTALALAQNGYVVAAPTHEFDKDPTMQGIGAFLERPRQIKETIDFMLHTWSGGQKIAQEQIGIFGFSAGGFTALVAIGAVPDTSLISPFCRKHPDEFLCTFGIEKSLEKKTGITWEHDPRIKAAVVSSPALGFAFSTQSLKNIISPIQLWYAKGDEHVPYLTNTFLVRDNLPTPPQVCAAPDAGHFIFMPPCEVEVKDLMPDVWEQVCIDPPGVDRAAFHHRFNNEISFFFRQSLLLAHPNEI